MSRVFLKARWRNLVMANYAVDPALLGPYLPAGTWLDFHEGRTYVSLVGFVFQKTRLFGLPVPFYGDFEEVNLRFYVIGEEDGEGRRGVVFIDETVPFRPVAFLANLLYSEHYRYAPMSHRIGEKGDGMEVDYEWSVDGSRQHIRVQSGKSMRPMGTGSKEEFILEHYYGYTRISDRETERYRVAHPAWKVHDVRAFDIECDFGRMYGSDFAHLTGRRPDSVFLAHGSEVQVEWKRFRFRV
jgi:uncharacterized protein YqjF (DUF2071 family)